MGKNIFGLTVLALLLGGCNNHRFTESNYSVAVANSPSECHAAVAQAVAEVESAPQVPQRFSVISWNIEKGSNQGWDRDFRRLSYGADLVLLQEALFIEQMQPAVEDQHYWAFTSGYITDDYESGLMTHSRFKPKLLCSLRVTEPWLRTPKSTSVALIQLDKSQYPLMVINQHSINFTIGAQALADQLNTLTLLIGDYPGPVVLGGDLNTWNKPRQQVLDEFMERMDLEPVTFSDDIRSKKLGNVVDYILVKGARVVSSEVVAVDTSDHNPLNVQLEVQ